MSKRMISIFMVLLLCLQVVAIAGPEGVTPLKAGTYTSEQLGHNGKINFEITLSDTGIE